MLVENQTTELQWTKQNRKYYESLGYKFTDYGDLLNIYIKDLTSGSHKNVKVQCDYCGKIYTTEWRNYLKIANKGQKNACKHCKVVKKNDTTLLERQTALYDKALLKCNENGYVLITNKEEIKNNTTYVKYVCPVHGEHQMRISNLIRGKGCPDCAIENSRERYKLSSDEVERRIQECGGKLLNKKDYINQAEKNLFVECPECSKPFLTSLRLFVQHGGQVCDDCSGVESLGEKRIRHYLEGNKIHFIPQKWFPDCRDINPLPFDFYLPDHNIIVEFDGRQHFGETNYFTYSFEETKKHDEIKNNYCKINGIYLIRIPYWNVDKIEEILDKELILHEDIV